jgi:hypothetical protein
MLGFAPLAGAALASSGDANTRTLILAATDAQDVAVFHVDGSAALYLLATEVPDVAAFASEILAFAALDGLEYPDIASFVVQNINLELVAVEAPDVAAFAAAISGAMALAATEAPDAYSQSAYILWLTPDQPDDPSIWVPKNDPAPYLTTVI